MAALRKQLVEAVTEEVMADICRILILRARAGHLAAVKLLFTYVLGAAPKPVDPDTLDLQEMEQYRRELGMEELAVKVNHALTPEIACATVRAVRPVVMGDLCNAMADQLLEGVPPDLLPPDRQPPSPNDDNGEAGAVEPPAEALEIEVVPPSPIGENGPATTREAAGGRSAECPRETRRASPAAAGPRGTPWPAGRESEPRRASQPASRGPASRPDTREPSPGRQGKPPPRA